MAEPNDRYALVGTIVADKYAIERVVGEGGFGVVFRATHRIWDEPVALKCFTALSNAPVEARDELLDQFVQEGKLLSKLSSRTTGIVQARGFKGSRAGQIWLFNRADGSFKQIISDENENRWPQWKPDGKGLYFVRNGNLWQHDLASGKHTAITNFKDDLAVFPAISRDGGTLVFRVRFDLYRWHPGDKEPVKIEIEATTDATPDITRVVLENATDIHFTPDGLQMAFISGGDIWVMDAEIKEPRRVTQTAEEEREVLFSPDAETLVFVSDTGGVRAGKQARLCRFWPRP